MSLIIKGMKMPKDGFVEILIRDDGTVQQTGRSYRIEGTDYYAPYIGEAPGTYEAIPVPPHRRLIDANALARFLLNKYWDSSWISSSVLDRFVSEIANAPTIISADEGEA